MELTGTIGRINWRRISPLTTNSFQIDQFENLHVLRDDLLTGGTKLRALSAMARASSADKIAYAGTVKGHGALALAYACKHAGKKAVIFISGSEDDPILMQLRQSGAELHILSPAPVDTLFIAAKKWGSAQDKAVTLPPGFSTPEFDSFLCKEIKALGIPHYDEIWTTAVTGTLTRALQKTFPETTFKTVRVVRQLCDLGKSTVFEAPEKYHKPALVPPPYPSCPYTDAKCWQFAVRHAQPGALVWNTAG